MGPCRCYSRRARSSATASISTCTSSGSSATVFTAEQIQVLEKANKSAAPFLLTNALRRLDQRDGGTAPACRHDAVRQRLQDRATLPLAEHGFHRRDEGPRGLCPAGRAAAAVVPPGRGAEREDDFVEEKHGPHTIIGYRFGENQQNKDVATGILFNFSPCFVRVGDKFVISTTLELARTLIDELEKESKAAADFDNAAMRAQFSWEGVNAFLGTFREQLVTQNLLDNGGSPEEAKKQVELLLALLGRLGRSIRRYGMRRTGSSGTSASCRRASNGEWGCVWRASCSPVKARRVPRVDGPSCPGTCTLKTWAVNPCVQLVTSSIG